MVDGTGAFAVGQGDLYSIAGMQIFGAFDHALGTRNHRIASRQNLQRAEGIQSGRRLQIPPAAAFQRAALSRSNALFDERKMHTLFVKIF